MKRKIVSIVMASAMVFGLAACGSSGGTTTSSSNGGNDASAASETTAKSESSDVVEGSSDDDNTLTVWTWDPNFNVYAIKKAAEIYAQDHEGFKVEVSEVQSDDIETRLTTAVSAGDLSTLPDIFLMQDNSFQKYATNYPDIFNEDGSVNIVDNKALKPILEIYSQMVKDGTLVEVTDWDQYIASINNGTTAGVINGCWIMASITANEDQSGKWAITNMPKLDGVDGATNYSNNGGSSWAISSNCKKQDLAIDFMKSTFAGSTALYDDIIAKGALATWAPAGDSEAYAQPVAFFSDDPVYAKIVDFATKTPSNITGAFYYDARDAVGTALSNIIQTGADMDSELQTAQETVEFNMGG
jgi:ABC-type glycerol-3-phosphate transport system substrate-binding protein